MYVLFSAIAIKFSWSRTPRCAGKYEVYKSCGSACAPTCSNYKNPIMCTEECVPGCYCKDGYIRNTVDGSCCLPSQCPGKFLTSLRTK